MNNSLWVTVAHQAVIGAMSSQCQLAMPNTAMNRSRADVGLPSKQHIELMAGKRQADIMCKQFKRKNANDIEGFWPEWYILTIHHCRNTPFLSETLDMYWCLLTLCLKKSVANLSEKQEQQKRINK